MTCVESEGFECISDFGDRFEVPRAYFQSNRLPLRNSTRSLLSLSTMKQLDIRISAVKRLTKEMKSRRVDVETEKKRKERFISEGGDQWTVGKQVLQPSSDLRLNDSKKLLQKQRK